MRKILLAEDDESLRRFLSKALERAGYAVRACEDGETAVEAIEVARQAAARQPGLQIMFITGFAAVALSASERAPAGAKILAKPVHLREIVSEVERMVAAA